MLNHDTVFKISYQTQSIESALQQPNVIAVFSFGLGNASAANDPRHLQVRLQPCTDINMIEVWETNADVTYGHEHTISWSKTADLLYAAIEVSEQEYGNDINVAAQVAYEQLIQFVRRSETPHLLRIWNYINRITTGDGDLERYRQFCVGRAEGLGDFDVGLLPAATAIGRYDERDTLQIYCLAARVAGTPIENPRQVSAYLYPRQYGPQPPSFARAMLAPASYRAPLLLSGTASVVGHASLHGDDITLQLQETFVNLRALIEQAKQTGADLSSDFSDASTLKVYVRDEDNIPTVIDWLETHLPADVPRLVLHAAICRRELLVEIDGTHR